MKKSAASINDRVIRLTTSKVVEHLVKCGFTSTQIDNFFKYNKRNYTLDLPFVAQEVQKECDVEAMNFTNYVVTILLTYAIDLRHKGII